MTSLPAVPLEILEIIFSNYGQSDLGTLRACSLVSTTFQWPAQAQLFASVDLIRPEKSDYAYDAFQQIVVNSPHLARCITRLGIDLDNFVGIRQLLYAQVLTLLPNVRHATLFSKTKELRSTASSWLVEDITRGNFLRYFFSAIFPQLWTLRIKGIPSVDLTDIASHCLKLRSLSLESVSRAKPWEEGTVPLLPTTLRSLIIDDMSATQEAHYHKSATQLAQFLRNAKVESLVLTDQRHSTFIFGQLSHLSLCKATLVHLDLGLTLENNLHLYRETPTFDELQMSEFTSLRTFSAMFTAQYAYLVFNWFEHACSEPWTIETVTLDFLTCGEQTHVTYMPPFLVPTPRVDWYEPDWFNFDSMLVSKARLVFGERFVGHVTVPDNIAFEKRGRFRQAMRDALPKSSVCGTYPNFLLEDSFSVTVYDYCLRD
ncbi:hypothetical protein DL96DRAFT_1715042 [Flagelloscypha sp. PMI_526]|nr:hypothetical protein DL96DRAFT_1715042 [Flagelloscypha sp. PMI_526]